MSQLRPRMASLYLAVVAIMAVGACTSSSNINEEDEVAVTPSPSAATPPEERDASESRRELASGVEFRDFCATRKPPAEPAVAAFDGEQVTIMTDDGSTTARIKGKPPVRWSASGRLLAVGPEGELWTDSGERYEGRDVPLRFTKERGARWAWSPSGDCALILTDGRLDAFHTGAGANTTNLVTNVESFWWGPSSEVAVVLKEDSGRSLWIADLEKGDMRRLVRFPDDICCVVLGGWDPDGERVLYWAGPSKSAMKDGSELHSADAKGRTKSWGKTLPQPGTLSWCGETLVAVTGGGRSLQDSRLSLLRPNEDPEPFTLPADFSEISCSSDGRFVIATDDADLMVFPVGGLDGTLLTYDDPRLTAFNPEWGPPRTGVLFVRSTGNVRQLWFIPEGSRPRFLTELPANAEPMTSSLFDWSATVPVGTPLPR